MARSAALVVAYLILRGMAVEHRTSTGRTSAHGPAGGRITEQGSTVAAPVAGRSDWIGPLDTEYTTVPAQQSLSHAARLDTLATAGFVKSRYFEMLRRRYHWDGRVPLLDLPDEMKKRSVKLVFIGDSKLVLRYLSKIYINMLMIQYCSPIYTT